MLTQTDGAAILSKALVGSDFRMLPHMLDTAVRKDPSGNSMSDNDNMKAIKTTIRIPLRHRVKRGFNFALFPVCTLVTSTCFLLLGFVAVFAFTDMEPFNVSTVVAFGIGFVAFPWPVGRMLYKIGGPFRLIDPNRYVQEWIRELAAAANVRRDNPLLVSFVVGEIQDVVNNNPHLLEGDPSTIETLIENRFRTKFDAQKREELVRDEEVRLSTASPDQDVVADSPPPSGSAVF